MLCYFYYISPLLFQKWGMVKAGCLYLECELGFRQQSSSGSLPVHSNCSNSSVTVIMWECSDMEALTTIWPYARLFNLFFKLANKGARTHRIMENWTLLPSRKWTFPGWVATQQQMVDLNKNSIHSLFCHFLVFLLILSMFNNFLLKYERFLIY